MAKEYELIITSAVVLKGKIARADEKVTVPERLAKNLLARGKAELAPGAAGPGAAPAVDLADGTGDGDAGAQGEKPLGDHTVAELREIAASPEYEIDGAEKMKKAELIEAIEAAEQEGGEE